MSKTKLAGPEAEASNLWQRLGYLRLNVSLEALNLSWWQRRKKEKIKGRMRCLYRAEEAILDFEFTIAREFLDKAEE